MKQCAEYGVDVHIEQIETTEICNKAKQIHLNIKLAKIIL